MSGFGWGFLLLYLGSVVVVVVQGDFVHLLGFFPYFSESDLKLSHLKCASVVPWFLPSILEGQKLITGTVVGAKYLWLFTDHFYFC